MYISVQFRQHVMSGIIIFKSDVGDFPTYLKFIVNFIKLFGAVLLWCKSLFSCSVWLIANKYSCLTSVLPTRNILQGGCVRLNDRNSVLIT